MSQPLSELIANVAALLSKKQLKIVFAESCTGGLVSASLARIPGISEMHCGSAVVYRPGTKTAWLGVPAAMLVDSGPVSEPVARAMVEGVLARTLEADLAASITGHLGPGSPPDQDGLIFIGVGVRGKTCRVSGHRVPDFSLASDAIMFPGDSARERRQWAAVEMVLSQVAETLRSTTFDY
jgi:nicotinamide-nucleotide amidase